MFFEGHFLSKFNVLVKFIVYLPASSELGRYATKIIALEVSHERRYDT